MNYLNQAIVCMFSAMLLLGPGNGPTFQGLGFNDPTHDESAAVAVSPDGYAVIGISRFFGGNAPLQGGTIWYPDGSFEVIPSPSPHANFTYPAAVSTGGGKVVGTIYHAEAYSFAWDAINGSSDLSQGTVSAISHDGSVICGAEQQLVDGFHILAAWRIVNGQKTYLGGFPQSWGEDRHLGAMTSDGAFIAGTEQDFSVSRVFIWNESSGFEYLESPGDWNVKWVRDMAEDNHTVVGIAAVPGAWEAVIWRRGQPPMALGDFPGGAAYSDATVISRGGHLVLGFSESNRGREAFLWDAIFGFQHFGQWIEEKFGLDLGGWTIREIFDMSADNNVIVGKGTNPDGLTEGWVLRLNGALLGLAEYLEMWTTGEITLYDLISAV